MILYSVISRNNFRNGNIWHLPKENMFKSTTIVTLEHSRKLGEKIGVGSNNMVFSCWFKTKLMRPTVPIVVS